MHALRPLSTTHRLKLWCKNCHNMDVLLAVLQVCIFAYGQTGSGKTYTMFGNEANRGIIPRAMAQVRCAFLLLVAG